MSRTLIKAVSPTEPPRTIQELHNSWLFAPPIWSYFCKKFFGDGSAWLVGPQVGKDGGALWQLDPNGELNECERTVMRITYDLAYLKREDFSKAVKHLVQFNKQSGGVLNNQTWYYITGFLIMPEITLQEREKKLWGVGFHATTVSQDLWGSRWCEDDEGEREVPFDWNTADPVNVFEGD